MIKPLRYAIAFDMDGVVFRTTMPKHHAMLGLFPETMKEVASDAIMGMSGVARKQKLASVYETCFGRAPSSAELKPISRSMRLPCGMFWQTLSSRRG
jgi:hypothetical protein